MPFSSRMFFLLSFLSGIGGFCHTGFAQPGDGPPNIIFILTDDQRFDALGYAGNRWAHTPEMDKLARAGTYFSQALVTTPICAASRASIFSGVHERSHRYTFQTGPLREAFTAHAYPKWLKEAGYYTGFYGKLGIRYATPERWFHVYESYDRNGRYRDRRGYFSKTLNGDTVHLTRYTGEKAIEFIGQAPSDQPFCLSLSFSAPHAHDPAAAQYFWQAEQDPLYVDKAFPEPAMAEDRWFAAQPEAVRAGFNRTRWYWRYDQPEKYQHSLKGYYRMIAGIDRELGRIRQALQENSLAHNTVIILMGDNGYFLGERQLAGKWLMYEPSVRVPLIIYDPRLKQHRNIDQMALNVDIPPTIAALAGLEAPISWQGKSLLPLMQGQDTLARDTVLLEHLWEFVHIPPSEGVRTAQWKYLRYVNDPGWEELYDLSQDPLEQQNLAKQPGHAHTLQALRQACERLGRRYGDPFSGTPTQLAVEFIRDPRGTLIQDSLPEYSWTLPEAVGFQQAYQVLVATSAAKLQHNQGDVWNSGQVRSTASVGVSHQGLALAPERDYFWKVRIWDQDNRLSDYSAPQHFRSGRFGPGISTGNRFQVAWHRPQRMLARPDGSYFIDFGKAAFGNLEIQYESAKPDTLWVHLGEKSLGDQVDRQPGGSIRYQAVTLAVRPGQHRYLLPLAPDPRNTNARAVALPDSFGVIMPFRYVEIEGATHPLQGAQLRQQAFHTYFDDKASYFHSSDSLLNEIWALCKYSIKATSFAGVYVDGDRERIPYEADAYLNQLGHYGVDREYAMARQTIEYFMTHPTWPTEWLLHTAMLCYQDYRYTGDTELIAHYYEALKAKTLIALAREDGLISTQTGLVDDAYMRQLGFADPSQRLKDIVDWPPAQADTGWKLATAEGERDGHQMLPVNTVVNSFFYFNMQIMAAFAEVLGRSEDRDHFAYMAAKVKKAINQNLFDPDRGLYLDGEGASHASLHANMLPLAMGLVPPERIDSVVKFIKSRGMACSVYGAQYLLEGLYKAGEGQYALDLMRATHDRSWANMLRLGSTITLEAWDMKYKPNADWNHAWGAAPANIIPRYLWGIQPQRPGFAQVRIVPQLGDLTTSQIQVPTLLGPIQGAYERLSQRQRRYRITLPANMVGEFVIAADTEVSVSYNGKPTNPGFGSIRLHPGVNQIDLVIHSF